MTLVLGNILEGDSQNDGGGSEEDSRPIIHEKIIGEGNNFGQE